MTVVRIDGSTGCLLIGNAKRFPLVLSNGPPATSVAPSGKNGLAEVAAAGISFLRTGTGGWSDEFADGQLTNERAALDAAESHGLQCWSWLGELQNLPAQSGSAREQLLAKVVGALKAHPGLGAWKGHDEPSFGNVPVTGLVRGYAKVKSVDPDHPLVIIEAPRQTAPQLQRYNPALDITGADIYPVSYPPGTHAATTKKDIGLVGDQTAKMVRAAAGKPVWMTLQIAWSGILPPGHVPTFPTAKEERFMAYQAIIAGARGLAFFGGHLPQVMRPADAKTGWNWHFWTTVLQPLVAELSSTAVNPALTAREGAPVKVDSAEIQCTTRQDAHFLYVLAVRRGGTTSQVSFTGLPNVSRGEALFEYANDAFRPVTVRAGTLRDWFGPYDAHVYRFPHAQPAAAAATS
ncbi:MAG TPA: hypothetical protein VGM80_12340 [Gaiellaceae bacterium]